MSMYPIVFAKRRRETPAEFERLRHKAHTLTEEYRKAKCAPDDGKIEEDPPLVE